jgi:hypothetical protein
VHILCVIQLENLEKEKKGVWQIPAMENNDENYI